MTQINMRVRALVAVLTVTLWGVDASFAQQIPATAPSQAVAGSDATAAAGSKLPSALLQPGIDAVRSALAAVRLDKWKASEAVRDEADANLNSIRKDMDATLPALLATADSAPDSVVRVLPAYRNVEALYDVLLRVAAAARVAAPSQSAALDQAMLTMDAARRGLGDKLQVSAAATEKQVGDLRLALKAAQTPPPTPTPAPAAAPPITPVKKKRPAVKKPVPVPAPATQGGI